MKMRAIRKFIVTVVGVFSLSSLAFEPTELATDATNNLDFSEGASSFQYLPFHLCLIYPTLPRCLSGAEHPYYLQIDIKNDRGLSPGFDRGRWWNRSFWWKRGSSWKRHQGGWGKYKGKRFSGCENRGFHHR